MTVQLRTKRTKPFFSSFIPFRKLDMNMKQILKNSVKSELLALFFIFLGELDVAAFVRTNQDIIINQVIL